MCLGALALSASPCAAQSEGGRDVPYVAVDGPAEVRDVRVQVSCAGEDIYDANAHCHVRAAFVIEATAEVRIALPSGSVEPGRERELLVDGSPLTEPRTLPAGTEVRVAIDARRVISRVQDPLQFTPMQLRHPILGETGHYFVYYGVDAPLVRGNALSVGAPAQIRSDVPPGLVEVNAYSGEYVPGFSVYIPRSEPSILLRNAGPVLMGGATVNLDDADQGGALVAAGYEIGLDDWFFVSVFVGTDFESLFESLVVEVAAPGALVVFPSASVGIGVVARQLGDRDADAALRFRGGLHYPFVGFVADLDYWPAIGQWTATLALRVGI